MARAVRGEARSVSPQRLGVFNCLNARERIRCHPEFAAVTIHLAREESTRAHREDSESIQPPRPPIIQESYNLDVHQSDLTQVKEDVNTVIVHLSPYAVDIGRLNSAK
jgi:hypothetical protein